MIVFFRQAKGLIDVQRHRLEVRTEILCVGQPCRTQRTQRCEIRRLAERVSPANLVCQPGRHVIELTGHPLAQIDPRTHASIRARVVQPAQLDQRVTDLIGVAAPRLGLSGLQSAENVGEDELFRYVNK